MNSAPMEIPYFEPNFDESDHNAVLETLRSGWISMGARAKEFEEQFASMHQATHAVAVTNGTAALHLALTALGIKSGDDVIVPSLSFVATATSVLMAGATPVFADITSLDDWTLSAEHAQSLITPRTKAIIPMHYGGYPADMEALMQLAEAHNLYIIEDACHAPNCYYKGKALGTWGHAGCFSFYTNKNITCGEGGIILFRDARHARTAETLRAHGMSRSMNERATGAPSYTIEQWGYNYRLDDLRASLGVSQLRKLDEENTKRRQLSECYKRTLEHITQITLPFKEGDKASSYHLQPILLKDNGLTNYELAERLKKKGIGTSMHYPPIHKFPAMEPYSRSPLPLTEAVTERELTLPMHGRMNETHVRYIADSLHQIFDQIKSNPNS